MSLFRLQLFGDEGQQSDLTGALDRLGQLTLMHGTGAGGPAGQDLGALGNEAAQLGGILVVDIFALVNAELADLAALAVRRSTGARGLVFAFHSHGSILLYRFCQNGSSPSSSISAKPPPAGAE